MTLARLMNLPYRLSAEQKAWLKGMKKDKCPEIAEAAQMVYAEHFPYAERNERKKQLHISEMTFVVQDELWDEYGDSFDAQIMFILDRKTRLISCTQAGASNTIELTAKEMRKLLNRIVNAYEVFCWEEDFSQEMPDVLGEEEDLADIEVSEDEEQPSWSVSVSYSNGEKQQMKGFDIPIRVNELALDLLQYFENDEDAAKAAQVLHEKGIHTVLITLGSRGVWASVNGEGQRVPGFRVHAVDTIAAGDTFNGALITALLEEKPLPEAIRFAHAAAAIAVTRKGAQPSVPWREEIDAFLDRQR